MGMGQIDDDRQTTLLLKVCHVLLQTGHLIIVWLTVVAAPQLKVSDDRLTVTGEKGYSMIRATHGTFSHDTVSSFSTLILLVGSFDL